MFHHFVSFYANVSFRYPRGGNLPYMTARGPSMIQCAKWLLRARPADYALALSVAGTSLPVVGKHLEPLGAVTAMSVWGARQAPEAISAVTKDWLTPGTGKARRQDRESTQQASVAALRGVVSAADLDADWPVAV